MIRVDWATFKGLVDSGQIKYKCITTSESYDLYGYDGAFNVKTQIDRGSHDQTDVDDYEANYQSGVSVLAPKDSDGATLNRTKVTKSGHHYQLHCMEFTTSDKNSLYNKDSAGVDLGFCTLKFYNAAGTELTDQATIESTTAGVGAVKTVLEWEAQHDFGITGAQLFQSSAPSDDVRLFSVGVPDVPKAFGGSVDFIIGGLNLKHLGSGGFRIDGKTAKDLTYVPGQHYTKFQIIMRHAEGVKAAVHPMFDIFKSETV